MNSERMNRRELMQRAVGGAAAALGASALEAAGAPDKPPRPNLLVVFADQQHWEAVGCRNRFYRTPHLDKLAAEGVLFDRAFCNTPQCSPTRSSILTGLVPTKTGVMGNIGAAGGQPLKMNTVAAHLKAAGYRTGYFGKWHVGNRDEPRAGWDEALFRTNDAAAVKGAVAFIKSQDPSAGKPFALFVSINDPHDVYHFRPGRKDVSKLNVPLSESWQKETFEGKPAIHKQFMTDNQGRKIWGRPRAVWQEYRDFYREKVALYDACVGEVLGALSAKGLAGGTVVIATSDHGDMETHHRLIFKGPFMYEHMVRVPLIVRVPPALGGGKARRTDWPAMHVDLTPTLLDLAGAKAIDCDGVTLRPLLTGEGRMPDRPYVIGQYYGKQRWVNPIRMIRTDRYKYNRYIGHGEELYDLKADPHELHNLAGRAKHEKVRKDLRAELDKWIAANDDPFDSLKTAGRP